MSADRMLAKTYHSHGRVATRHKTEQARPSLRLAHRPRISHVVSANKDAPTGPGRWASIERVPSSSTTYSAASLSSTDGRFDPEYGFGFSAGGLLFPYMLGVCSQLQELGILTEATPVAGASAGSIVAVCSKSGLSTQLLTEALMDLAADCRRGGTRARLRHVLARVLHDTLPADIHERCEGRVFLAVTQLWPQLQNQAVSSFSSRDDLIDTVLVSCHIPYWFDGSLFRPHRNGIYCDGGLTDFIPRTPTGRCHKVCCFPSQSLRAFPGIELAPDTFEAWPHDMRTMLGWAFEPADDATLMQLLDKGRRDATTWAQSQSNQLSAQQLTLS